MNDRNTVVNALIGAAVTVVLSFTAFSPILGGAVAGYLERGTPEDGIKVGVLSGAISSIPFLFLLGLFSSFLFAGSLLGGGFGVAGGFTVFLLFVFFIALVWNVGLGALGGYIGVYVAKEGKF